MRSIRNVLAAVMLAYPVIVGAIVVIIRDNDGIVAMYNVDYVHIGGNRVVTAGPDRIFFDGF